MVKLVLDVIRDYLLPIALGGIIGGLAAGAFFIWPTIYGAKWWEVFTALGTVGAVVLALFQDVYKRQKNKERQQGVSKGFAAKIDLERNNITYILRGKNDSDELKTQKVKIILLKIKNSIPQVLIEEKPVLAAYMQVRVDKLIGLSEGSSSDSMSDYYLNFIEFRSSFDAELRELSAMLREIIAI